MHVEPRGSRRVQDRDVHVHGKNCEAEVYGQVFVSSYGTLGVPEIEFSKRDNPCGHDHRAPAHSNYDCSTFAKPQLSLHGPCVTSLAALCVRYKATVQSPCRCEKGTSRGCWPLVAGRFARSELLPTRWLLWYAPKSNPSSWSAPPPLPDFRRQRQLTRTTQRGFAAPPPSSLVLWTCRLLGARV